jgi:tetratricopeptide (TPR) repeat protein/predicted Ser/Thr protein kinase
MADEFPDLPDPLTRSEINRFPPGEIDPPTVRAPGPPVPPEVSSAPPDSRVGKFIRVQKLGAGGMGEVWKAWDADLGRWVALKFLKETSDEEVQRFAREAQLAGKLSHPYIAGVYEIGEDAGRRYIAMQFIDGLTLRALPRGDGTRMVRLVRDAARAVAYAHSQGVLHRDLKPDNLMVRQHARDLHLYVMDFGLARAIHDERVSVTGSVVGTPAYMPPEQARGERVDERVDVYALGATLYELLSGRPPFKGSNVYDILKAVQEEDPPPLERVDRDIRKIVARCMEKERDRRYPTVTALAEDLERWMSGQPILARAPSMAYRLSKWMARRKAALIPTAVILLLVLGIAGWIIAGALRRKRDLAAGRDLEAAGRLEEARDAYLRAGADVSRIDAEIAKRRAVVDEKERALKLLESARAAIEQAEKSLYATTTRPDEFTRRLAQAGETLDQALKLAPSLAVTHHLLGIVHELAARYDEAEAAWRKSVALDPAFPAPRWRLGKLLLLRVYLARIFFVGEPEEPKRRLAERLALEAVKLLERSEIEDEAQRELARAMIAYARDDMSGARRLAQAALAKLGDRAGTEELVWLAGLMEPLPEGQKRCFDRALSIRPYFLQALVGRAFAKRWLADLEGASADLDEALRWQPRLFVARMNRGFLRSLRNDHDGAIDDFGRAAEIDPAHPLPRLNRGIEFNVQGRAREAMDEFRAAAALGPALPVPRRCIGDLLSAQGDVDGAIAEWTEAIRLDANYVEPYANRGNAYARRGDHAKAIADYTVVLSFEPKNHLVLLYRGVEFAKSGRNPEAIADLERALKLAPADWVYRGNVEQTLKQLKGNQ